MAYFGIGYNVKISKTNQIDTITTIEKGWYSLKNSTTKYRKSQLVYYEDPPKPDHLPLGNTKICYVFSKLSLGCCFYDDIYEDPYDAYKNLLMADDEEYIDYDNYGNPIHDGLLNLCLVQNNQIVAILPTQKISIAWSVRCLSKVLYLFDNILEEPQGFANKYDKEIKEELMLGIEFAKKWLKWLKRFSKNFADDFTDDLTDDSLYDLYPNWSPTLEITRHLLKMTGSYFDPFDAYLVSYWCSCIEEYVDLVEVSLQKKRLHIILSGYLIRTIDLIKKIPKNLPIDIINHINSFAEPFLYNF